MFEDLTKIEVGDKVYPIKCDNYVLAKLQEKFETISEFEKLLIGLKENEENGKIVNTSVEPSYTAINAAAVLMVAEGVEIYNEECEEKIVMPTEKQIIRNLSYPTVEIALILHNEFVKCFKTKKSLKVQSPKKKETAK